MQCMNLVKCHPNAQHMDFRVIIDGFFSWTRYAIRGLKAPEGKGPPLLAICMGSVGRLAVSSPSPNPEGSSR